MSELFVRPARSADLPFIFATTKKSLRHSKEYADQSNFQAYGTINPAVNNLFAQCEMLVAEVDGVLVGHIVFRPTPEALTVGYLYVKHEGEWRRRGIAKDLLTAALDTLSPDATRLEYVFPTKRFEDLAADHGFVLAGEKS